MAGYDGLTAGPAASIKVTHIPSFVTQGDFSRLMSALEGNIGATLMGRQPAGDQIGYVDFKDENMAVNAMNAYQGWTGFGGRGFVIERIAAATTGVVPPPPPPLGGAGQKRGREDEEAYQAGNSYKQPRPENGSATAMTAPVPPSVQHQGAPPPAPQAIPSVDLLQGDLLQGISTSVLNSLIQSGLGAQLLQAAQSSQQQHHLHVGPSPLHQQGHQPQPVRPPSANNDEYNPEYVATYHHPPQHQQPQQQIMYQAQPPVDGYKHPPQQAQYQPPPQPMTSHTQPAMQAYQPNMMQQQQRPPQQAPTPQYSYQAPHHQQHQQQQQYIPAPPPPPPAAPQPLHLPHDAAPTLYVEGFPEDVTKRELEGLFRQHSGYKSLRLVVKDSKKYPGQKLVMAFVEFASKADAAHAMAKLQDYVFDVDDPESMTFFMKYARPLDNPRAVMAPRGGGRGGAHPGGGRAARGRGGGDRGGGHGRGGRERDVYARDEGRGRHE